MRRLSQHLLESAAQSRCGLLLAPSVLGADACDLPGIVNAAVPEDPVNAWQTVSGAVARDRDNAVAGAIAEGLERLAAASAPLPLLQRGQIPDAQRLDESCLALFSDDQRAVPGFPWPMREAGEDLFSTVYRLHDNAAFWVPQELVGLGPRAGVARLPSTSSGLAAHRDATGGPWLPMLRAAQEVLERDALATTWLNGLGGRQIPLPPSLQAQVDALGGQAWAFDLTQQWNPHPVIAIAGGAPREGLPRHVLGAACRETYPQAFEKAWLEWAQSLTFAGHMSRARRHELPTESTALRRFDEHAAFYTLRPDLWAETALLAHRAPYAPGPARACADSRAKIHAAAHDGRTPTGAAASLQTLESVLRAAGVDLYYRELTTCDVAAAGLRVMRVLAPQLTGLHADERAPFLGGRCGDVAWRYPGAIRHTAFPNPLPHPLG